MSTKKNTTKRRPTAAQLANVARARARRFAMQAIYQYLVTGDDCQQIIQQATERQADSHYDTYFFTEIIEGVTEFKDNFDLQLSAYVSRPVSQLDYVEHAILLVAVYELNSSGTPPKVAINEAILIAKKFGSEDSHKFVNGVLDKLYHALQS